MRSHIETPVGPVRQGDRVVIKQGAEVRSMHPSRDRYQLARRQTVVVRIVMPYGDAPYLSWAGSGGYWCDTAPGNVERVVA